MSENEPQYGLDNFKIGEKLSPVLVELENALWESEVYGMKPDFSDDALRASAKIFMSVMMDKLWELQVKEKIDFDTRCDMAEKCGQELRKLVKTFTDIDTHEFYK